MVRRLIITALTLAALSTAAVGWAGYAIPVYGGCAVSNRHHCYVCFSDGLVRLSCSSANEPIYLVPSPYYRWVGIHRLANDDLCVQIRHLRPAPTRRFAYRSMTFGPLPGSTAPTIEVRGLRMGIGVPMTLLIAYPFFAFVRARYRHHRHRSGHCPTCEYDLTGNTSGVCPECGTPTDQPVNYSI